MLGIGQSYITCLLGVAYPVFKSFLTLDSGDAQQETQWLTYWVMFGIFQIIDHFAGFILHFIPFYYVLKMFALIYMFHPSTQGATYIFNNYVKENFDKMEKQTSEMLAQAKRAPKTE